MYAAPSPKRENNPAPKRAPIIRAVSIVVRDRPIADISLESEIVSPMSPFRITRSDGRTKPANRLTT